MNTYRVEIKEDFQLYRPNLVAYLKKSGFNVVRGNDVKVTVDALPSQIEDLEEEIGNFISVTNL